MTRTLFTSAALAALLVVPLMAYADHGRIDRDVYSYDGRIHSYGSWEKPSCSIAITNRSGTSEKRSIQIAWSSSYATSAHISGIGAVATNGSQAVFYPYRSHYTLTVHGPRGTTECETGDHVISPLQESRSSRVHVIPAHHSIIHPIVQPIYQVTLTQMPYTGFDYGPIGNAFYWLGMVLASLLAAHFALTFLGRGPRALAMEVVAAGRNQLSFVRSLTRRARSQ